MPIPVSRIIGREESLPVIHVQPIIVRVHSRNGEGAEGGGRSPNRGDVEPRPAPAGTRRRGRSGAAIRWRPHRSRRWKENHSGHEESERASRALSRWAFGRCNNQPHLTRAREKACPNFQFMPVGPLRSAIIPSDCVVTSTRQRQTPLPTTHGNGNSPGAGVATGV